MDSEIKFKLDKEFSFPWGRNKGTMHSVCSQPKPNTLFFQSRERAREWDITSRMEFSQFGMVNTRTFNTTGVLAKKYFKVR